MNTIKKRPSIFFIFVPLLLSIFVYWATKEDIGYLETLQRNLVVPPIVFPIVWTILYILMGVWNYFYEQDHQDDVTTSIYWVSVLVNMLFSFLLFTFHQILLALIDVLILFFMILYLFIKSIKEKKKYAYLLVPYLLWLIIAFTLMVDLWIHN